MPTHSSFDHSISEAPLTLFGYHISFEAEVAMCYNYKLTLVFLRFVVMTGYLPNCRSGKIL